MNIIRQLFEIILRKRAPEDIDYNINASILACAAIALGYYCIYSSFEEFSQPTLYALILTSSHIVAYALLLKLHGKENRLVQTLTTLMGTTFILCALAFIFLFTKIFSLLSLFLFGYSVIIAVRIIKSSFSCPTYLAIVIYVSVSVFSSSMLSIVAPSASKESQLLLENLQKLVEEQSAAQEASQ